MGSFFTELKRRHVFRIGIAYLAVAWLIVQVVAAITPILELPNWFAKVILVLLAVGFPIALILAWAFELTPEGIRRESELSTESSPTRSFRRKWDFIIIGTLVFALGLALWDRGSSPPINNATPTLTSSPAATLSTQTIAVLPFTNMSSDPEQEYFSDGLSEEILNDLSRIEGLKVSARTSSFAYKRSTESVQSIAHKLGVGHILEGSVRKSRNRLRINVQLIDATNGYNIMSKTYDRELEDIFAIQEEIAESVANALSIKLGLGDRARIKSGTNNLAAYNEFLTGRALINNLGPAQTLKAAQKFVHTTELDPNFAEAWSALGDAYITAIFIFDEDINENLAKAENAVRHALQINPDLASAHYVMGYIHGMRAEWARSDQEFTLSRSTPSEWNTYFGSAILQLSAGKAVSARDFWLLAREKEPQLAYLSGALAYTYEILGKAELADNEFASSRDLVGDREWIEQYRLIVVLARGDEKAIREVAAKLVKWSRFSRPMMDKIYSELIAGTLNINTIRNLSRDLKLRLHGRVVLASWAAYLGDDSLALENLGMVATANPILMMDLWSPLMKGARQQADFKKLVRDLGLVDYWREFGWPELCHPVGDDDFECE